MFFVIGINHSVLLAQDYPNDVYINPLNANTYSALFNQTTTSFGGNLILTNNVSFALTNAELQFSENSRIIIETGSHFDGAGTQLLLTNYTGNGGDHWQGIDVLEAGSLDISTVEIVDVNGKTVRRQAISKDVQSIIDLRSLISGHYQVIFHLTTEDKVTKKLEIIK